MLKPAATGSQKRLAKKRTGKISAEKKRQEEEDDYHLQASEAAPDKKDAGGKITWDEFELISKALIPLNLPGCPLPEDIAIAEGLEELAKIVEEGDSGNKS